MSGPHPDDLGTTGGERRRLDRAPGDRLAAAARDRAVATGGTDVRAVALAVVVSGIGGLVFFVLGQQNLGAGLLAVAGFTGWMTAVVLVDLASGAALPSGARRIALAAGLAGGAILAAILLDWAWAALQGGVLGPLDYVGERYGPAALADIGIAAILAGLHAR